MKILCLGDSLTDCNRMFSDDPLGDGYVSMLSAELKKEDSGTVFLNRGVDGFTVSRLLENARSRYLALEPDVITILIGINDLAIMQNTNRTEAQKKVLLRQFSEHYDSLIRTLQFRTKQILLIEPFLFPYPQEFSLWMPDLLTMSESIRHLAERHHCSFLPMQQTFLQAAQEKGFPALTTDGVHLTREGQALLASRIRSCLPINHS